MFLEGVGILGGELFLRFFLGSFRCAEGNEIEEGERERALTGVFCGVFSVIFCGWRELRVEEVMR